MRKNNLIMLFFAILSLMKGYAQESNTRTVSGIVKCAEGNFPVEGVTVLVKGTDNFSGTQADGIFYICVRPQDSVLVFTMDDFKPLEVKLGKSNEYYITLMKESTPLSNTNELNGFLADGKWRGSFFPDGQEEIPFLFDVAKKENETKIFFINGDEKFDGGNIEIIGDSFSVRSIHFETELIFAADGNRINGLFRKQDKSGRPIRFSAERGIAERFQTSGSPSHSNLNGKWEIDLLNNDGTIEKAVGLIEQKENKIQATLLRLTGDARYLEGIVTGNAYYLSAFIGSTPVLYKGVLSGTDSLFGEINTPGRKQIFKGIRNAAAALADPYSLTKLKSENAPFNFSFPNVQGRQVSLSDQKYKNKVVVIAIGGSWCPNCIDEASFLSPWYIDNRKRGVEVIGLYYERNKDPEYAKKAVGRLRDRFNIQYDQLIGGVADKQQVAASLPALNTFIAFPTTIFIDKKGKVAKIHTGFNGPATGKYYDEFINEFNTTINSLLNEKP